MLENLARRGLPELEVGSHAGAGTESLGGGVDAHEDDVVVPNAAGDVGAEEQVPAARSKDQFVQPRLVDGQCAGIPFIDAPGIDVHHGDSVVRAFVGDHGHRRPAHVAGANA